MKTKPNQYTILMNNNRNGLVLILIQWICKANIITLNMGEANLWMKDISRILHRDKNCIKKCLLNDPLDSILHCNCIFRM